jgi:hypothetical protein
MQPTPRFIETKKSGREVKQYMEEKNPLSVIAEAIAYLLSGIFVIEQISQRLTQDIVNNLDYSIDWLIILVGVISIVSSFLFLLYALPKSWEWVNKLVIKSKPYLLLILFPITIPQIVPVLFEFNKIQIPNIARYSLSVVGIIFTLLILTVLICHFIDIIKQKKKSLERLNILSLSIIFTMIIRLLQGASTTDSYIYLVILAVLTIVSLYLTTRKEKNIS